MALIAVTKGTDGVIEFMCSWRPEGVDPRRLNSVLLDISADWQSQRKRFGGVFVAETVKAPDGISWNEFLALDEEGSPRAVWLVAPARLK